MLPPYTNIYVKVHFNLVVSYNSSDAYMLSYMHVVACSNNIFAKWNRILNTIYNIVFPNNLIFISYSPLENATGRKKIKAGKC